MGKPHVRYVAKAVKSVGWRIWNRQTNKWWGNFFKEYPEQLLDELNGLNRYEAIVNLLKSSYSADRKPD